MNERSPEDDHDDSVDDIPDDAELGVSSERSAVAMPRVVSLLKEMGRDALLAERCDELAP